MSNQPYPHAVSPSKKRHTVRNVIIGVVLGGFLLIGGCTALIGGALSSVDTEPPGVVTVDNGPTPDPITTPTNHYTPTVTVKPTPKATQKPAMTASQEQAVGKAEDYLSLSAFSRSGLIEQLEFEGFSKKDATYAADHVTVNWNEQAAEKAKSYLEMTHFSRSGLVDQLEFDGFTHAQAVYGVEKAGL